MTSDSCLARDGAQIAYQFTGSGTPIGYAHGVFLSRRAVRRLELFDVDALAEGRRLLAYDQREHGNSTGRPVCDDCRFGTSRKTCSHCWTRSASTSRWTGER